jgi:hypothetical protein
MRSLLDIFEGDSDVRHIDLLLDPHDPNGKCRHRVVLERGPEDAGDFAPRSRSPCGLSRAR